MKLLHYKSIFLIFFVIVPFLVIAQYKFTWGKEFKDIQTPMLDVTEMGGEIFVARSNMTRFINYENNIIIERIAQNLEIEGKVNQELFFEKKRIKFKRFLVLNDKLFFLGVGKKNKDSQRMLLWELNSETLLPTSLKFEFFNETDKVDLLVSSKSFDESLEEKDKLIIVTKQYSKEKPKVRLNAMVLNSNLNLIYSKEFDLDLITDRLDIRKIYLDKNDNIYIAAYERPRDKKFDRDNPKNKFTKGHFWQLIAKTNKLKYLKIDLRDEMSMTEGTKYVRDLNFLVHKGQVNIIGLYSQKKWEKKELFPDEWAQSSKGIFVINNTENDFESFVPIFYPMKKEILHSNLKKGIREKLNKNNEEKELNDLRIKEVSHWNDKMVIISEVLLKTRTTSGGGYIDGTSKPPRGSTTNYSFYAKDLVIFKCDLSGKLLWMNNISKVANVGGKAYPFRNTYLMQLDENKIDFFYLGPLSIFNNNGSLVKNTYLSEWNKLPKKGFIQTSLKYVNGEKKLKLLNTGFNEENSFYVWLRESIKLSNNKFLLFAKRYNQKKIGIMELEKY